MDQRRVDALAFVRSLHNKVVDVTRARDLIDVRLFEEIAMETWDRDMALMAGGDTAMAMATALDGACQATLVTAIDMLWEATLRFAVSSPECAKAMDDASVARWTEHLDRVRTAMGFMVDVKATVVSNGVRMDEHMEFLPDACKATLLAATAFRVKLLLNERIHATKDAGQMFGVTGSVDESPSMPALYLSVSFASRVGNCLWSSIKSGRISVQDAKAVLDHVSPATSITAFTFVMTNEWKTRCSGVGGRKGGGGRMEDGRGGAPPLPPAMRNFARSVRPLEKISNENTDKKCSKLKRVAAKTVGVDA